MARVQDTQQGNIQTSLDSFKKDTVTKFTDLSTDLVGNEGSIMPRMLTDMNTSVTNGTSSITATIKNFALGEDENSVVGIFKSLYKTLVGKSIVPEMMTDIQTAFETGLAGALGFIETFKDEAIRLIGQIASKIADLLASIGAANEALKSLPKSGDVTKPGEGTETGDGNTDGGEEYDEPIGMTGGGIAAPPVFVPGVDTRQVIVNNNNFNTLNMTSNTGAGDVTRGFNILKVMNP
jgi:hypothetical protein